MSFLFTNPLLLAALAGLGIPVIIHLLLKRKSQRLRFSTIRFFQKQDEQASSKRKLRNLLLLLLRLLVFALIVLAFARPYLPILGNRGNDGQPRALVVVLDYSASLQANDGAGSRWNQVRKIVRDLLAPLKLDDRVALVTCGPKATVAAGFGPPMVAAKIVEDLPPPPGAGELSAGLREAIRLVAQVDPKRIPSVVVISDFQKASAQNLAGVNLPQGLEVTVKTVGDLAAPNEAVVELNLETANDSTPHAMVASHGEDEAHPLEVEFKMDGIATLSRTVSLSAGAVTNIDLSMPVLKPGWHSAEFRIRGRDSLGLDNSRFAAFYAPEPVRVLLVEGRRAPRPFNEQTFFVAAALDPAFGTTNTSHSRFGLRKIGPDELAGYLAKNATNNLPEMVMLPSQRSLTSEAARALRDYVIAGGGLMLWVGDEVTASRFNTDLAEVSPVMLRTMETSEDPYGWHLGERDKSAAIFASFRQPDSGNLALPGFLRRFTLTPMANSLISARFEDGVPLLAARTVGRGRVVFANTSADTAWSDWPKRKTFVPWLHDTAEYLANRGVEDSARPGVSLIADTGEDLELGATAAKKAFTLIGPAEQKTNLKADDQGHLDLNLQIPGVYSLKDQEGQEWRRLAVNPPASESNLAAYRAEEFQQQLVRAPETSTHPLEGVLFGSSRNQRELWRVLLFCALGLLFVETIFSNRSYV